MALCASALALAGSTRRPGQAARATCFQQRTRTSLPTPRHALNPPGQARTRLVAMVDVDLLLSATLSTWMESKEK
jgi:hypothetical protein